ncbi:MAG: hypothetical protein QM612_08495, partial [Thermomonas sp.]|uniref:hypothetical protein n=1 Tax=Thermomonas sp. TaxID=1971895 RepID=UPI0039E474F4
GGGAGGRRGRRSRRRGRRGANSATRSFLPWIVQGRTDMDESNEQHDEALSEGERYAMEEALDGRYPTTDTYF